MRISCALRTSNGSYNATVEVRRVRNGSDTLLQSFTTTSTTDDYKSISSVSVYPGDRIYARVKGNQFDGGKGYVNTTGYIKNFRLLTDGSDYYPLGGGANSEGW